jgi:hypothetical protein
LILPISGKPEIDNRRRCPAETALTCPAAWRRGARLAAVRGAAATIRPALVQFYEALDQGQKDAVCEGDLRGKRNLTPFHLDIIVNG